MALELLRKKTWEAWQGMLSNLLLACVNVWQEAGAERALCYCTVAAAGAGVEKLPCRIVATAGAGAKVSPAVTSSHCSSMADWHVCVLGLDE